jgi:biopolymer transport protein ExbB/TolQ
MFEGKSIWDILQIGGFTMYILLLCSVIALAVILERTRYFRISFKTKRIPFMEKIRGLIEQKNIAGAVFVCGEVKSPLANVVKTGLQAAGKSGAKITNAMERQIAVEQKILEKNTNILGTIGSTVVYIGLFGTVIGIIRAFQDIAQAGATTGINLVITGIAEALVCTAAGIFVAVPSVIAYNFLIKRVETFVSDMQLCASEAADLLGND